MAQTQIVFAQALHDVCMAEPLISEADNEPPYMEMRSLYQFNDDSYSTRVETKEKIDFMLEQIETTFTICESFERVETSDEIEIRRKEFAEKQA